MFIWLQIMCAKYYELRYSKKNFISSKLARLIDTTVSKFVLFLLSGSKHMISVVKQF